MIDRISAKSRSGRWVLGKKCLSRKESTSTDIVKAVQQAGWAAVARTYQKLETAPTIWQLEFTKAILGRGESTLGYAEVLAKNCEQLLNRSHSLTAPAGYISLRSCTLAILRAGHGVAGAWIWPVVDRMLFFFAGLTALLIFLAINIVTAFEKSIVPKDAEVLLAVYGEWSNRTMHVLNLLDTATAEVGIIVVGRPTRSLGRIREQWEAKLGAPIGRLCRPFTLTSSISSLPLAVQSLVEGFRLVPELEYRPPFSKLVGIALRCCMGASSQHWWRRQTASASTVVYGQTGLADTTMLEFAQQASGVSTVHAVHGLSNTYNFAGRSTVAVFRCGYDAHWYRSLDCYGRCESSTSECPSAYAPGSDFFLFTNYSHPMNLYYLVDGNADEKQVLSDVQSAISSKETDSEPHIFWKPHPSLATHNSTEAESLKHYGEALGYKYLGDSSIYQATSRSNMILTTPSTVVLDALRNGSVPIVLNWQGINPSAALSRYPLMAHDCEELGDAISLAGNSASRARKFNDAWALIAPAKPLSWSCLNFSG